MESGDIWRYEARIFQTMSFSSLENFLEITKDEAQTHRRQPHDNHLKRIKFSLQIRFSRPSLLHLRTHGLVCRSALPSKFRKLPKRLTRSGNLPKSDHAKIKQSFFTFTKVSIDLIFFMRIGSWNQESPTSPPRVNKAYNIETDKMHFSGNAGYKPKIACPSAQPTALMFCSSKKRTATLARAAFKAFPRKHENVSSSPAQKTRCEGRGMVLFCTLCVRLEFEFFHVYRDCRTLPPSPGSLTKTDDRRCRGVGRAQLQEAGISKRTFWRKKTGEPRLAVGWRQSFVQARERAHFESQSARLLEEVKKTTPSDRIKNGRAGFEAVFEPTEAASSDSVAKIQKPEAPPLARFMLFGGGIFQLKKIHFSTWNVAQRSRAKISIFLPWNFLVTTTSLPQNKLKAVLFQRIYVRLFSTKRQRKDCMSYKLWVTVLFLFQIESWYQAIKDNFFKTVDNKMDRISILIILNIGLFEILKNNHR